MGLYKIYSKSMITFKTSKQILGWVAFAIALITYVLTLEPTLSFWDAGEYIATSTKLQVGHPPGAPLYQMLGALFSLFASDVTKIAYWVNMVAAVSSAFTILFMYWSGVEILHRILRSTQEKVNKVQEYAILGSTFVGALAFTFSDSFWFSAVEAEVYATAMLLISVLLWAGLKWTENIHTPRADKWLLLIGLVIGLSFGVHFMALLTIPTIGYLYYFAKYPKITLQNFIGANAIIIAILLFSFLYLMPWTFAFFGKTEIFFVNSLNMPFNSGTIFGFVLIVSLFVGGLFFTQKKQLTQYNTLLLTVLFIFIGFSSWLMLPIRANTQIPINENKPSDAAELKAYYNREQYGERSLFYDTFFTVKYRRELDKNKPYIDGKPNYERNYETGKYEIVNNYKNSEPNYSSSLKGFLPRMWSTDGSHPLNYMRYGGPLKIKNISGNSDYDRDLYKLENDLKDGTLSLRDYEANIQYLAQFEDQFKIENPTFFQNMKFMFDYQFGYMYWRYLMWNFSGRQNDIQGAGGRDNGNWVTGISFLDEIRLGSQKNLPSDLANNKGRNHYYMLPFILGLIGAFWHSKNDWKSFYMLAALFVLTSFALKVFLNERPFEPRERDYAVVGSFMVFALWIGMGVFAIFQQLAKKISPKVALPITFAVSLLAAPVLMAKENWDDHDRSGKDTALALAKAYLDSIEPNGIVFTIGDNDTFPLWYLQEVEGYRTDVRVVCTALLQAEWYIDQMKVAAYDSKPLKIRFDHKQYAGSNLYYAAIAPSMDERVELNDLMEYIANDDPRTKVEMSNGEQIIRIPTKKFKITVDKEKVLATNTVSEKYAEEIVSEISLDINDNAIYRQRIIMLDIISNNLWERPVYFTSGSLSEEDFLWMKDYMQLTGLVYKLVPIKTPMDTQPHPIFIGNIDTEKMYQTVKKWDWGNMGSDKIYHDPETRKNAFLYRINLSRLAETLYREEKREKAIEIADIALKNLPIDYYGIYESVEPFAELYYRTNEIKKADDVVSQLKKKRIEYLAYYASMPTQEQDEYAMEIIDNLQALQRLADLAEKKSPAMYKVLEKELLKQSSIFKRYIDALRQQQEMIDATELSEDSL